MVSIKVLTGILSWKGRNVLKSYQSPMSNPFGAPDNIEKIVKNENNESSML
jgi:hypothetical protein